MTRPARRPDRRTLATTATILEAAQRLFAERGFHAVTMDAIAEEAAVAVGSIYHHFGNKDTLYLALVERALEINEQVMAQAYTEDRTPVEQLIAASDAYCRFNLENPGHFRMVALRAVDMPPGELAGEVEQRIADKVEALVADVADALRRADAAGQIDCPDPGRTSVFLWSAWNGVLGSRWRPDRLALDDAELERVLAVGRDIVIRGLRAG